MADEQKTSNNRSPWVLRAAGLCAVFIVWLLFGGNLSSTGLILGAALVGGGGLLVWLSYRKGQDH